MEQQEKKDFGRVWFGSDFHFCHANILKHQPNRIKAMGLDGLEGEDLIRAHDKWIIDKWHSQTKRGDVVYLLGDIILSSQQVSLKILTNMKSKGVKVHLILGNHDKSIEKMYNMFESISQIKVVDFKKNAFSFLETDFPCVMCHYPMESWPRKCHGAMHLYGHVHDNSPWLNDTQELKLNVGIDAPHMNYGLISLEDVYAIYKSKLQGMKPKDYIDKLSVENPTFVR